MLRELSVQNLATIEDVQIELEAGFCAWSGETGAGKSLLLTALGLVLGGKASSDLVRAGKPEARAAAVFEIEQDALRADVEEVLGWAMEDGSLIINRRVSAQGRSSAQVNGMPVTIGVTDAGIDDPSSHPRLSYQLMLSLAAAEIDRRDGPMPTADELAATRARLSRLRARDGVWADTGDLACPTGAICAAPPQPSWWQRLLRTMFR